MVGCACNWAAHINLAAMHILCGDGVTDKRIPSPGFECFNPKEFSLSSLCRTGTAHLETQSPRLGSRMDVSPIVTNVLLVLLCVVYLVKRGTITLPQLNKKSGNDTRDQETKKSPNWGKYEEVEADEIVPVDDSFDWAQEPPARIRPFKPGEYHMTMGIKRCSANDWLRIEDTYQRITKLRSEITAEHKDHTVIANPIAKDGCYETYNKIIDFMCQKYPRYFVRVDDGRVHNTINDCYMPGRADYFGDDLDELLLTIVRNIEEDVLILLFDEETGKYFLRAGCFVFPSGFDPAEKVNKQLKDIHQPVPLYSEKLERAMDNYFQRIAANQYVERANWSCQTHTKLYSPLLNHAAEGIKLTALKREDLNFDQCFLRCERQILTRLPKTKHLVFTSRTYTTPLSQIKAEGLGPNLALAIEGLPPRVAQYKKRDEWGPAIISYMRDAEQ